MKPKIIIDDLRKRGFDLWVERDKIRFMGTTEPMTQEMLAELKSNKPELIRILKSEQPTPYLNDQGDLVIPFGSDPVFHWWKTGSLRPWKIRDELKKRMVN